MTPLVTALAALSWPKVAMLLTAVAATAGLIGSGVAASGWIGGVACALLVVIGIVLGVRHHRARRW